MRQNSDQQTRDYQQVERAIQFLHENFRDQPSLEEIAEAANLSPHHLQRLFTRWAGVSPMRFIQSLSLEEAKRALARSESVLDASLTAGLSEPGRLHNLFVTIEALTPGDLKVRGKGLTVHYGTHTGPYGAFVIAITDRGICGLQFIEDENTDTALDAIRSQLPAAEFITASDKTLGLAKAIFNPSGSNTPFAHFRRRNNLSDKGLAGSSFNSVGNPYELWRSSKNNWKAKCRTRRRQCDWCESGCLHNSLPPRGPGNRLTGHKIPMGPG